MIIDEAVKRILDMADASGQFGGAFHTDEPSAAMPVNISDGEAVRIQMMSPQPQAVEEEGEEILGTYEGMHSPGTITLGWDSIGSVFWHFILDMQAQRLYMEQQDLEVMATVMVQKTYLHERFHHFCDVAQRLLGRPQDIDTEEALAVAASYLDLADMRSNARSKLSRLSGLLYRELTSRMFNYAGQGYRDWVNYRTPDAFAQGLFGYLAPPNSGQFLQQSGVDLAAILLAMKDATLDNSKLIERLTP